MSMAMLPIDLATANPDALHSTARDGICHTIESAM